MESREKTNIDQDFILLIMNCQKYREKAVYQKNGWLQKLPDSIIYFHVIGNLELDSHFKIDYEERILWLKVEDDYNSLPKKVISAYQCIGEVYNYKYIFKTDDDQNLINDKFFPMIQKLILSKKPKPHYGGFIIDVKNPYFSEYYRIHPELPEKLSIFVTKYCSGRFYFLSKEAIRDLLYKKELIKKEYLEDYAIGFHMNNILKCPMLNVQSNKYFIDHF